MEIAPAQVTGAIGKNNSMSHSTRSLHEQDSHEDREIQAHIAALREAGYAIGVACHSCGAILTARRSVALAVGPVCRGRLNEGTARA